MIRWKSSYVCDIWQSAGSSCKIETFGGRREIAGMEKSVNK